MSFNIRYALGQTAVISLTTAARTAFRHRRAVDPAAGPPLQERALLRLR